MAAKEVTLQSQIPSLKANLTLDISRYDSSDGKGQSLPEVTPPYAKVVLRDAGSFSVENSIVVEEVSIESLPIERLPIRNFRVIQSLNVGPVPPRISFKPNYRALANALCQKRKGISIDEEVLGGMPHLRGLRVSVPNVLTHLYHLGSIDAVVAEFEQRISKEQVKEAIAYAHDFMEMACDPSEADD